MENNYVLSPKYLMSLVKRVHEAIWQEYSTYKDVNFYIKKWHIYDEYSNNGWENFSINKKPSGEIDVLSTLHGIDSQILLKIAVDLGIDTPDFIPSVATFRNEIKSDYQTANSIFDKAFKQIETHPDIAIGLANSALESIIKEILKDDRISIESKESDTLYDLTSSILKQFKMFPHSDLPTEIKTIGSTILAVNKSIEGLRSTGTTFHGKTGEDYLIKDPIYTYFIVNSVTTVGLFLNSYYKTKFPKPVSQMQIAEDDDLPF